jgi:hypothetical protein
MTAPAHGDEDTYQGCRQHHRDQRDEKQITVRGRDHHSGYDQPDRR